MYDYKEFKYLYPPRPDFFLTYDRIPFYEKDGWVGQYKKNGTCAIVAISPTGECLSMNRHNENHRTWDLTPEIRSDLGHLIPRGVWTMLVGEILHLKTKTIKDTIFFHDVIVHQSKQLVGMTFADRQEILKELLPAVGMDNTHHVVSDKIWRAKLLTHDILKHFQDITDPSIDEGIVLKQFKGKLKSCDRADANKGWQYKIRYPTKNYQF